MAPLTLSVVFIVILGFTTTLPGHIMVKAEENSAADDTLQTDVNGRFNRMESRLERIEKAITAFTSRGGCCGPKENEKLKTYSGCQDALERGQTTSGVYTIAPDQDNSTFNVYCEQRLDGGGWTVFQVRKDGSVDFYRDWNAYKDGFGNLKGEFWLGNAYLHRLTKRSDQQLKVELTSFGGQVQFADYSHFSIGPATVDYRLSVSGYTGGTNPGDSMSYNNGESFSTKDQDNDRWSSASCATSRQGAWWYGKCTHSNLNGLYGGGSYTAVFWYHWTHSQRSLKATRMMVRTR